jgi:hypothetical protein
MTNVSSAEADKIEHELLSQLTCHPVLEKVNSLPQEQFFEMLLQRRFISLIFSTVYDIGIDALTDDVALKLARQISREEYPDDTGETPSHREDLVHDLGILGVPRTEVLACRPTDVTISVVVDTLKLIGDLAASGDSSIKVLTMLRFWGEVVVSVEYGEYWKRMISQFDRPDDSHFYLEHYSHDGRESLTSASEESETHSGKLGACLKDLLAAPGAIEAFKDVEARVLDLRLRFYDQFLGALPEDADGGDRTRESLAMSPAPR